MTFTLPKLTRLIRALRRFVAPDPFTFADDPYGPPGGGAR